MEVQLHDPLVSFKEVCAGTGLAGNDREYSGGTGSPVGPESRCGGAVGEPSADPYLSDLEEMDQDDCAVPWPQIPVAAGAERDELREELVRLARHEAEIAHARLDPEIAAREAPLSGLERDEVQAAPDPHAELMRREEESCFRIPDKHTKGVKTSDRIPDKDRLRTQGPVVEPEPIR